MSSERSNATRPVRPTIASNRTARSPLTPRLVGNGAPSTKATVIRPASATKSEPLTPRIKATANGASTPSKDGLSGGNVTPRSSARKSRLTDVTLGTTLETDITPSAPKAHSTAPSSVLSEGTAGVVGASLGIKSQNTPLAIKPKSVVSESRGGNNGQGASVRQPDPHEGAQSSTAEPFDSRFFHASDAVRQEFPTKKAGLKKTPTFFYADGQHELIASALPAAAAPLLAEGRSPGLLVRSESGANTSKSPPILSPALSALSSNSPFFSSAASLPSRPRSPSPGKSNIHLSYRKGVSQIIGTRPTPPPHPPQSPAGNGEGHGTDGSAGRRQSVDRTAVLMHSTNKSPSVSSLDSTRSPNSRRRSGTITDTGASPSPLIHEVKSATVQRSSRPSELPLFDTYPDAEGTRSPPESALSPTKAVSELAADARRERKVLDLEISNSSLLAINTSLEREVRRQKAELKRFRRLTRAGRFSLALTDRSRLSDGLSRLGEEDEEEMFGPPSGHGSLYDEFSDDDESLISSNEPTSPRRASDRLWRDEQRLQLDLEKHKELLVQSQMMNQSLKRCMYATEEMVREGKKALEYHVRVSDVKLGGRVLSSTGDADEDVRDEIEVAGEAEDEADHAKDFLDVWSNIGRPSIASSEGGDRDSGIEVDRLPSINSALPLAPNYAADQERPLSSLS